MFSCISFINRTNNTKRERKKKDSNIKIRTDHYFMHIMRRSGGKNFTGFAVNSNIAIRLYSGKLSLKGRLEEREVGCFAVFTPLPPTK